MDMDMGQRTGRFMRLPEVLRVTGLSRSTINRLEKAGLFPHRRAIGPRAVGWPDIEVSDWVESRRQPDHGDDGGPKRRTRRAVRGAGEQESGGLQ